MQEISSMKSNKVVWIEILRIFACFSVVLLHVSATHLTDIAPVRAEWKWFLIYNCFSRFAVPAFVMISGMLYLDTQKELSIEKIYRKYILKLSITYIFWLIFYSFSDIVFWRLLDRASNDTLVCSVIKVSLMRPKYHLWYLPTIIGLLMVTPLLREIICSRKAKQICEYAITLFLMFKIMKVTVNSFEWRYMDYFNKFTSLINLEMICNWSGFFFLGYYINNYEVKRNRKITLWFLGIIGIVVGIILCYTQSLEANRAILKYCANFSLFSTIFSIAIVSFFKDFCMRRNFNEKIIIVIEKVSSCTLGIYLLHPFVRNLFSYLNIDSLSGDSFIWPLILTGVIFGLCFVCIYTLKMISKKIKLVAYFDLIM